MNTKQIRILKQNDGFYYPLFNFRGLRSSITPYLAGDLKLDHHRYALVPTTEVDLFSHTYSRNVIFNVLGVDYFLNGQTEHQQDDTLIYETDLLYQTVIRKNQLFSLKTTSYVPLDANIEVHEIIFENLTHKPLTVDIHTAIPLYGRSADNLRDHRHVTSLLNQTKVVDSGIILKPTLSFDERGHQVNTMIYSVFAQSPDLKINQYMPVLDDYINGGSMQFPRGLNKAYHVGDQIDGYETLGAIGFEKHTVNPNSKISLYVSIGIHDSEDKAIKEHKSYLNQVAFEKGRLETHEFFLKYISTLSFEFNSPETSKQLSWVMLQPLMRRYFGNSYMPHHDYGRGGRGWRDLWQDLLALIMTNDSSVFDLLFNNFAGIRIDGSNATIIGDEIGSFKADRNQITRVWSDHGAWPLLTTKMYLDETGHLDLLLKEQTYFSDQYTHYTKKTRAFQKDSIQSNDKGEPYKGTVLEHLLLQNLVGYHNIGEKGFTRLEDADWNDGLDMATKKGETIAFTHMYAQNLRILAQLIKALKVKELTLFKELKLLLNFDCNLTEYFNQVATFRGDQAQVDSSFVISQLNELAAQKIKHLHENAFVQTHYLSYYDNDGHVLDQDDTVNLTGQTMALLSQTASQEQASLMAQKTKEMLFDEKNGGYRLNTDYQKVLTNMGRAFGFAYGQKENGAIFSHMAIMYAYGLYQYNLVDYGQEAMMTLLNRALDENSKVWVGIPEYFNDRGVGKYSYLTGSASWLLKLMRSEVFGIQFDLGVLKLKPKLRVSDFINQSASIKTIIFNRLTKITYYNFKDLDFDDYCISKIVVNGQEVGNNFQEITGDIEVYLDEIV